MMEVRGLLKKLLRKKARTTWAWPHRRNTIKTTSGLVWEGGTYIYMPYPVHVYCLDTFIDLFYWPNTCTTKTHSMGPIHVPLWAQYMYPYGPNTCTPMGPIHVPLWAQYMYPYGPNTCTSMGPIHVPLWAQYMYLYGPNPDVISESPPQTIPV